MQEIKAKQRLYYTNAQVSSTLKVGFFPESKTWCSDCPQTLRPAFLANLSGILQLKNAVLGLIGAQEMRISSFEKWV